MTRARPARLVLATTLALLVAAPSVAAPPDDAPRVLVYSHTAGFRHLSIPDGIAAVRELGEANGFEVETSEDPALFTDETLAGYDAVVFLNTTGEVMTDPGRVAFERWVRSGGGYVGVHSAADTEYEWDFYGHLLGGAWFLAHPVQQPGVVVVEAPDQPSTAHLPERWTLPLEEFYSFRANPRERVRVLLSIDETTYLQDPNTTHLPNSPTFPEGSSGVMGDHPMSWCLDVGAGRAWYSALGHEGYLYRVPQYRRHLLGGILTALQQAEADCRVTGTSSATGAAPATAGDQPTTDPDDVGRDPLPSTGGSPLLFGALLLLGAGLLLARPLQQ